MDNSSLAGTVGPNPGTGSTTAVPRVIALLFMIMITNFNFTIYHLYMRQKPEFSNRLLNVLYSFHASLLQCGSFLILLIFCSKTMYRVSQKTRFWLWRPISLVLKHLLGKVVLSFHLSTRICPFHSSITEKIRFNKDNLTSKIMIITLYLEIRTQCKFWLWRPISLVLKLRTCSF